MKLVFFWNYLNIHQVWVADELFHLLNDDFRFVTTLPPNESELKGGSDYSDRPYCIDASLSEANHILAMELAKESEVCVFGACSMEYAIARAQHNPRGLSFECSERWLKKGLLNILSPRLIKWYISYRRFFDTSNFYKLCSSAYARKDDELLGCYKKRHFKWGYFTKFTNCESSFKVHHPIRLVWCGRFIKWKQPDICLKIAHSLKKCNCEFTIDLYGDGELLPSIKHMAHTLNVNDRIRFHGSKSNAEVLEAMRNSDIFLSTSTRQEGWGAVVNESLGCGCVVIASADTGSAPYLIVDGYNGFIVKETDYKLYSQHIQWLIKHPDELMQMKVNAVDTIKSLWNPQAAANALLRLVIDLKNNSVLSVTEGPCSKA